MVNPRLLDDDNVSSDAIKYHKVEAMKSTTQTQTSATSQSLSTLQLQPTIQSEPSTSQQASVEAIHNKDDITCHNAERPQNQNTYYSRGS